MSEWDDAVPEADFKKAKRQPNQLVDPAEEDRLPPHSTEAERGVIGCIILSPVDCLPICIDKLTSPEVFYDLRHRTIYEAMLYMFEQKEAIDTITLMQTLRDTMKLDEVGGLPYLTSLPDSVPSAANLDYYIEIVREKHTLRVAIAGASGIVRDAYDSTGSVDEVVDKIQQTFLSLSSITSGKASAFTAKDVAVLAMQRIEHIASLGGQPEGLPTGFADIDKIVGGFKGGEMIVLAARPSAGKTALALNISSFVAVDRMRPTMFFSVEMSKESLMVRELCSRAGVSSRWIRDGMMTAEDLTKLTGAYNEVCGGRLYIDDAGGLSIMQLRARARRYHQLYGIELFVIDYLQMLHAAGKKTSNRQEEVGAVSRGIKELAKELKVPVLALAQLNRESEKDKTPRRPRVSDLRESGEIEQHADIIMLLYSKPPPEGVFPDPHVSSSGLIIAKNRDGETDEIELTFLKRFTRFVNAAPEPTPPS